MPNQAPSPQAKKSFGQHFLHDPNVLKAIAGHCQAQPGEPVLELGAGTGNLTALLAKQNQRVIAVERDRDLCPQLRQRFVKQTHVEIVEDNAKTIDLPGLADAPSCVLCGNIPYNLSAPLMQLALDNVDHLSKVVYLVQKELGERLAAPAGTRACGALSVLLQQRFGVSIVAKVGRGAFSPPPRVDSVVLAMVPQVPVLHPVGDPTRLSAVVHAAFSQRRKQLANSLKSVFERPTAVCEALGIDARRRAEQLSVQEFVLLADY